MNREDLAKLYEKANGWSPAAFQITMEELERFAALVAAAAVRESSGEYRMGWNDGQLAEREACAKLCDDKATYCETKAQQAIELGEHDEVSAIRSTAWQISVCAAAIRARGQQ